MQVAAIGRKVIDGVHCSRGTIKALVVYSIRVVIVVDVVIVASIPTVAYVGWYLMQSRSIRLDEGWCSRRQPRNNGIIG